LTSPSSQQSSLMGRIIVRRNCCWCSSSTRAVASLNDCNSCEIKSAMGNSRRVEA
jgi:hypothetical protein